jgi:hypothetical protein
MDYKLTLQTILTLVMAVIVIYAGEYTGARIAHLTDHWKKNDLRKNLMDIAVIVVFQAAFLTLLIAGAHAREWAVEFMANLRSNGQVEALPPLPLSATIAFVALSFIGVFFSTFKAYLDNRDKSEINQAIRALSREKTFWKKAIKAYFERPAKLRDKTLASWYYLQEAIMRKASWRAANYNYGVADANDYNHNNKGFASWNMKALLSRVFRPYQIPEKRHINDVLGTALSARMEALGLIAKKPMNPQHTPNLHVI